AVGAQHRLCAPLGKIEDGQAAMTQSDPLVVRIPIAEAIGASRGHMIADAPQLQPIDSIGGVMGSVDTREATHAQKAPSGLRPVRRQPSSSPYFLLGLLQTRRSQAASDHRSAFALKRHVRRLGSPQLAVVDGSPLATNGPAMHEPSFWISQ